MTAVDPVPVRPRSAEYVDAPLEAFGRLVPISRLGGQGRVHRPTEVPSFLGSEPIVVKLYRRPPPDHAARVLAGMVAWERSLVAEQRAWLRHLTAWPVATVKQADRLVGIAMRDVSTRFAAPFLMPSGRREPVLLALEHLLGSDSFLVHRGLDVHLDTVTRARVAEGISGALAFLHRHAIVASDIAPNNLLVSFNAPAITVCFIDCDSMVFRGFQALPTVETADWDIPAGFAESPHGRAEDAYKLGLVILRLFARSHDARGVAPHLKQVPVPLRDLLYRALSPDSANRPAAGEWQRALHGLGVGNGLNEHYPGPTFPRPAAPPRVLTDHQPRAVTAPGQPRVTAPGPPRVTAPGLPAGPRAVRRPNGNQLLQRLVMVLWLIALAAVIVLILSRLR